MDDPDPPRLDSAAAIEAALRALAGRDRRLAAIVEITGAPPLRQREPGFAGLAQIIVAQQLSVASAGAIWARLAAAADPFAPATIAALPDERLRAVGLSRPKIRTLRALAAVLSEGSLILDDLGADADEARARLCAVSGIGPWTSDIYLLFCHGHPDVWPVGDLALQHAVGHALGLPARPDARSMAAIGEAWRPWRAAAARLMWAYYQVLRGRDPVAV